MRIRRAPISIPISYLYLHLFHSLPLNFVALACDAVSLMNGIRRACHETQPYLHNRRCNIKGVFVLC